MTYQGQKNELGHLSFTVNQKDKNVAEEKKTFDLSFRYVDKSPAYSACEDHHAEQYFKKQSVQKHLRNMLKVLQF